MRAPHLLAVLLLVLVLSPLRAVPLLHEGELRTTGWSEGGDHGRVALGDMRVRYHISSRMGEPLQKFDILLEDANHPAQITDIHFRADVLSGGKETGYRIEFSPDTVGERGKWHNAAAWGSPDWNRWFLDSKGRHADRATTKRLFGSGLSLQSLQVVRATVRMGKRVSINEPNLNGEWRRIFVGAYGEDTPLTGLLPVEEQPALGGEAVTKGNERKGWRKLLDYCGDLKGNISVKPIGLAVSAHPARLRIWRTADALVLKGRFGLAKGTLVGWDVPGEEAKRVLDSAVDVELSLQLVWDGKTESCRERTRLVPGQQIEMAIRLPVKKAEAITNPGLRRAGTGTVTVSVPVAQRPPRKRPEEGKDPFAVGGGGPRGRAEDNPFLANTRDKANPFGPQTDGKGPANPAAKNPFSPKADGNVFERQRNAEREKQFLRILDAGAALLDRRDWLGADAKIRQALAVPGHDQDKRAVAHLRRMATLRHADSARFVVLLDQLAQLRREIEKFARKRLGEKPEHNKKKGKAWRERARQTFAEKYVATRQKEFVARQREAKAIMDADPELVKGLSGNRKGLVGLVSEPPLSAENYP